MTGNLQSLVEQALLKKHSPAAVLLNIEGDILYIRGRTGAFLEPAAGKANWNIHAMARDGLRYELADLINRAIRSGEQEAVRGLILKESENSALMVDMTAEPMTEGGQVDRALLITFEAMSAPAARRSRSPHPRLIELEQQLAQARLEL